MSKRLGNAPYGSSKIYGVADPVETQYDELLGAPKIQELLLEMDNFNSKQLAELEGLEPREINATPPSSRPSSPVSSLEIKVEPICLSQKRLPVTPPGTPLVARPSSGPLEPDSLETVVSVTSKQDSYGTCYAHAAAHYITRVVLKEFISEPNEEIGEYAKISKNRDDYEITQDNIFMNGRLNLFLINTMEEKQIILTALDELFEKNKHAYYIAILSISSIFAFKTQQMRMNGEQHDISNGGFVIPTLTCMYSFLIGGVNGSLDTLTNFIQMVNPRGEISFLQDHLQDHLVHAFDLLSRAHQLRKKRPSNVKLIIGSDAQYEPAIARNIILNSPVTNGAIVSMSSSAIESASSEEKGRVIRHRDIGDPDSILERLGEIPLTRPGKEESAEFVSEKERLTDKYRGLQQVYDKLESEYYENKKKGVDNEERYNEMLNMEAELERLIQERANLKDETQKDITRLILEKNKLEMLLKLHRDLKAFSAEDMHSFVLKRITSDDTCIFANWWTNQHRLLMDLSVLINFHILAASSIETISLINVELGKLYSFVISGHLEGVVAQIPLVGSVNFSDVTEKRVLSAAILHSMSLGDLEVFRLLLSRYGFHLNYNLTLFNDKSISILHMIGKFHYFANFKMLPEILKTIIVTFAIPEFNEMNVIMINKQLITELSSYCNMKIESKRDINGPEIKTVAKNVLIILKAVVLFVYDDESVTGGTMFNSNRDYLKFGNLHPKHAFLSKAVPVFLRRISNEQQKLVIEQESTHPYKGGEVPKKSGSSGPCKTNKSKTKTKTKRRKYSAKRGCIRNKKRCTKRRRKL